MLPKERDTTRAEDWEKRIRYFTFPLLWIAFFFSGALSAYAGISQDKCTEGIEEFDLLYKLSISVIPACGVLLFYLLNLYGFMLVLDDWYRISSTILHLLLYTYFAVLIAILMHLLDHHLEIDYNDSPCLDKFDENHQTNAAWAAVILCAFSMALIQLTPWKTYE